MNDRAKNKPLDVARFVTMCQAAPVTQFVENLQTKVHQWTVNDLDLPVTITVKPTCYICSPSVAYIDYAKHETRHFVQHPLLRGLLAALITCLAFVVRLSGLDRQVQLNNWLLSTNPVPFIDAPTAHALRDRHLKTFPNHALVIRSLNQMADSRTIEALCDIGFCLLPARQIYIGPPEGKLTKSAREDRRKLAKTQYDLVENDAFEVGDYARAAELYEMLYIDKYTALNPQYTALYIQQMHRSGLMRLMGLRDKDGQLVAVTGMFQNGKTLTQPIVGYDTKRPKSDGLYRMIMALAQDVAHKEHLFFNISAGAADFKRRRGAVPTIEFTAVYVAHLPLGQRVCVWLMSKVLWGIGIPVMKRFGL
ncbi:GNAT family N-acetyltransferase [Nereida sp. MMG025]|uniref:GNAT family N-acetyltransferase n=1 Tax=Nereida sp. MMG025 TaxID=2909981 RepID=UPI001F1E5CF9|nr:GNAT family N-acetyltransferase [Nereida sp. MMG025]MCF6443736.1 GNAT family N-acetyltransferase [Nereida sp. MMG025]